MAQQKQAKHIVTEYFDRLLNQKDLSVCDDLLAPDYIDHDAGPNSPPGPEATKKWVGQHLAQYPDLHIQIKDLFSENNRVAVRLVWTGTHKDTQKPFHKTGIVILHLNSQGKIIERWSEYSP